MEQEHKCCNKPKVKKGLWSIEEDEILSNYVTNHDDFQWRSIPELTGLKRRGKGCRLRWLNYLRPNLKHGYFTEDEANNTVFTVHETRGNKWAKIARVLPGRTHNEIKNFRNKSQKKKSLSQKNNVPTSVAILPIPILESSNLSTTFSHSGNIYSSQSLATIHNGAGFQPNPIIYPNLNQPPPLKQPQKAGFYNILPPFPESLPMYPTDHNQKIISPLFNTSSIPNIGWMNPSFSYDHGYLPFGTSSVHGQPAFNPSLMPASSGWVGSNPSYIYNNTSSNKVIYQMINTSSNLSNNAQSFPPANHMASTSVSATGNDQTNASGGPKDVFDVNEFFNFDQFCSTTHDLASSLEEGAEESQDNDMPTNEY